MVEQEASREVARSEATLKKLPFKSWAVPALLAICSLSSAAYGINATRTAEREAAATYPNGNVGKERQQIQDLAVNLLKLVDSRESRVNKPDLKTYQTAVDSLVQDKERERKETVLSSDLANKKGRKIAYGAGVVFGALAFLSVVINRSDKK